VVPGTVVDADVVGAEVVGRHPGEAAIVLLAPTGTAAETL
jgi:hypothetical protein